jgi:hypothetical protein
MNLLLNWQKQLTVLAWRLIVCVRERPTLVLYKTDSIDRC